MGIEKTKAAQSLLLVVTRYVNMYIEVHRLPSASLHITYIHTLGKREGSRRGRTKELRDEEY